MTDIIRTIPNTIELEREFEIPANDPSAPGGLVVDVQMELQRQLDVKLEYVGMRIRACEPHRPGWARVFYLFEPASLITSRVRHET